MAVEGPLDPWIAYATGAAGLAVIIVRALPSIFGPVGKWLTNWTDNRQRLQRKNVVAEVKDLQTSVKMLEEHLADLRLKAKVHAEWDRKVYATLLKNGLADGVGVPPDLF